jgi:catalase
MHRQTINRSRAAYEPNTLGGGCPFQMGADLGGFVSHMEKMSETKIRARSEKFFDHFSQARLFFESQTDIEKDHIVSALRFELGKVEVPQIRERMVGILEQIQPQLASRVAEGLGLTVKAISIAPPLNRSIPADGDSEEFQPRASRKQLKPSPELSIVLSGQSSSIRTRRIAILAADGCDDAELQAVLQALGSEGAEAKLVAPRLGILKTANGIPVQIHMSLLTASSVLFDAVFVPGGERSVSALSADPAALEFIVEAYKHAKAIGATGVAAEWLRDARFGADPNSDTALLLGDSAKIVPRFVTAVAAHRNWNRERQLRVDLKSSPDRRIA